MFSRVVRASVTRTGTRTATTTTTATGGLQDRSAPHARRGHALPGRVMRATLLAELLLLGTAAGFQRGPHHPRAAVSGEPRIESHSQHDHQHPKPMGDTKFTQDKPILHDKRLAAASIIIIIYARVV